MRNVAIIALALVMIASVADAREGQKRRGGQRGPGLAQTLDLSDEQLEKARAIQVKMKRERIKLRSQIELAELEFDEELQKEKMDQKRLGKLVKTLTGLHGQMMGLKLQSRIELSAILTPEQKKKLAARQMMRSGPGHQRQGGHRGPPPEGHPGGGHPGEMGHPGDDPLGLEDDLRL